MKFHTPFAKVTAILVTAYLSVVPSLVSAHDGPETKEEVIQFLEQQASAYHCAPAIAAFTAARKQKWAQKVLSGSSSIGNQNDHLLQDGLQIDADQQVIIQQGLEVLEQQGKRIMACDPIVTESRIRNSTCVLAPQVTEGPYYHSEGHPIRSNLAEWQLGLPFQMDIGVIDIETCQPVPNVLIDLWHANATGHYAGHPEPRSDLKNEKPAPSGLRKGLLTAFPRTDDHDTWLRGAWPTDSNGVAQFTSIFPGYYTGRATHVHIKVHNEWQVLPNSSFVSKNLIHTGQFFFDDLLNEQIDKLWPYHLNPIRDLPKRGRTRNWDDSLQIYHESFDNGYMPIFDVEKLGRVVTDGLVGYITVGINVSAQYDAIWNPTSGKAGGTGSKPNKDTSSPLVHQEL